MVFPSEFGGGPRSEKSGAGFSATDQRELVELEGVGWDGRNFEPGGDVFGGFPDALTILLIGEVLSELKVENLEGGWLKSTRIRGQNELPNGISHCIDGFWVHLLGAVVA